MGKGKTGGESGQVTSPMDVLQLCLECNREKDVIKSADDDSGWTLLHYLILYDEVKGIRKMLQVQK
jgi:hypothetical protein